MKKPPFGGFFVPQAIPVLFGDKSRGERLEKYGIICRYSNGLVEGRCVKERPSGACQMNHWRLLMAIEAYCVKCKAKKEMQDPVEGVTKNGKPITKVSAPIAEPPSAALELQNKASSKPP